MTSNSKLTIAEKNLRKHLLADLPKDSTLANGGDGITVLCVPDGANTRVYSSIASPGEQKFRRKVGEYHALFRWYSDTEGVGLLLMGYWTAEEFLSLETPESADIVDADWPMPQGPKN